MTKKIKDVTLEKHAKSYLDGLTLEKALHQIKDWIQQYGGKATLDIGQEFEDYGQNQYTYVHILGKREETDEEYAKRITKEKQQADAQAERERKEFERLSKKFADKA